LDARVKPEHDNYLSVIAGLVFITVIFGLDPNISFWIAGSSPAMTSCCQLDRINGCGTNLY